MLKWSTFFCFCFLLELLITLQNPTLTVKMYGFLMVILTRKCNARLPGRVATRLGCSAQFLSGLLCCHCCLRFSKLLRALHSSKWLAPHLSLEAGHLELQQANLFTCGVGREIESLRQSSYTAMIRKHGREKSPKDHTHPLDCVAEAVLYQDSVSTSMAVGMDDRIMVIYMNLTSGTGHGERFAKVVLGDQGRSLGAG